MTGNSPQPPSAWASPAHCVFPFLKKLFCFIFLFAVLGFTAVLRLLMVVTSAEHRL